MDVVCGRWLWSWEGWSVGKVLVKTGDDAQPEAWKLKIRSDTFRISMKTLAWVYNKVIEKFMGEVI